MSTRICKPYQCVYSSEAKLWAKQERKRAPAAQRGVFNRRLVFVKRGWCHGRFTYKTMRGILKDKLYHFTKGYRVRTAQ